MQATITNVRDPNPWNKDGQLKGFFINGDFSDGRQFSAFANTNDRDTILSQLRDLIGKPGEFDGESKTTPNGNVQLKLKSWPGKPEQRGGFGGGGGGGRPAYVPAYSQTQPAFEITQRSIQRACALERAVQCFGGVSCQDNTELVIRIAEDFFNFLSEPAPPPASPTKQFNDFVNWVQQQVNAGLQPSKEVAWKAAMTAANDMGFDQPKLRACVDQLVFTNIKGKIDIAKAQPQQQRQNNQPNAYQPAGGYSNDDDSLPF